MPEQYTKKTDIEIRLMTIGEALKHIEPHIKALAKMLEHEIAEYEEHKERESKRPVLKY